MLVKHTEIKRSKLILSLSLLFILCYQSGNETGVNVLHPDRIREITASVCRQYNVPDVNPGSTNPLCSKTLLYVSVYI